MNEHKARSAAIAARGEQIKTNGAEYLWICRGIKPALLPDKPVGSDPDASPDNLQAPLRRVTGASPPTRHRIT